MHASYGLVKTRLICYAGKMRMFTCIEIRIIPVVTSAHLHNRIILPAVDYISRICNDTTLAQMNGVVFLYTPDESTLKLTIVKINTTS